ncbi:MAG: T9SS type B sorting domain-containing protein [Bacteroidota bacterium]
MVDERIPVFAPTAFSPNGDGNNDIYRFYVGPTVEEVSLIRIFDRWGNMVYEDGPYPAFDNSRGWDGKLDGQDMNPLEIKQTSAAIYHLDFILKQPSNSLFPEAQYQKARALVQQGKTSEARTLLQTIIDAGGSFKALAEQMMKDL